MSPTISVVSPPSPQVAAVVEGPRAEVPRAPHSPWTQTRPEDPTPTSLFKRDVMPRESYTESLQHQSEEESDSDEGEDGDLIIDDGSGGSGGSGGPRVRQCRAVSRREVLARMEHARKWLLAAIVVQSAMVSLTDIEQAYQEHCEAGGQEPLSTTALARLIHNLFPAATKRRLGPRGSQKVFYDHVTLQSNAQHPPQEANNEVADEAAHEAPVEAAHEATDEAADEPLNLSQPKKQTKTEQQDASDTKSVDVKINVSEASQNKNLQEQLVSTSGNAKQLSDKEKQEAEKRECDIAANKLKEVLNWVKNQGMKDVLLKDYAHSASCKAETCSRLCMMFRRVRNHVVSARHPCSVLKLYSILLKLHVSSCSDDQCGIQACPALRATLPRKRSNQDANQSPKRQQETHTKSIIAAPLVLQRQSSFCSLPGSPVNSPPLTPDETNKFSFSPSQGAVQYMIVPVYPVSVPAPLES